MGAASAVRRAHSHPRTTHSPRTTEEYAKMFDRVLAAKYVQDLKTRMKNAPTSVQSHGSLPDLAKAAAAMQSSSALVLRQRRMPTQNTQTYLMPRLDICDCDSDNPGSPRITATFELPGMNKADISLEVRSGWLIVEGIRRPPAQFRRRGAVALTQGKEDPGLSTVTAQVESYSHSTPLKADGSVRVPSNISGTDFLRGQTGTETAQTSQDVDMEMDRAAHAHAISEIRYGKFKRAVRLPSGTDVGDIDANMADGMLVVSWPRSQDSQTPKQIRVA